jgi:hypothetical protein
MVKITEQEIIDIIKNKKGKFICFYFNEKNKKNVIFTCNNNHENQKRVDSFQRSLNSWCQECQRHTLKDAFKLAEKRGYKFLSKEYKNANTRYLWECQQGHQWMAKYSNIKTGRSCPMCIINSRRIPLKIIQDIAISKGGKCLTNEENYYLKCKKGRLNTSKLELECQEGHILSTTPTVVINGSWCPICNESISERTCRKIFEFIFKKPFLKAKPLFLKSDIGGRMEYDGYNEELKISFEYNGEQHYKHVPYFNKTKNMFNKQKEIDYLKQKLSVLNNIQLIIIPFTIKHNNLYTFILSKLLVIPKNTPLTIDYSVLNIKGYGKDRLEDLQKYIDLNFKGGKVMSIYYFNNSSPLEFKCKNLHFFTNSFGNVTSGSFCKQCSIDSYKIKMQPQIKLFCDSHKLEMFNMH